MILLVKDKQIDVSELYFITIKYQRAKGANQLWKDPSWGDKEILIMGGIVEIGGRIL